MGPLHPDITIEQCGPEQLCQVLLHPEERLLGPVDASDQ
jgi:hypothetical protein